MKNLFAIALVGSLLLAGCAGKKAMEEKAIKEAPPAVAVEEPPVMAPEPAPAPPVEVAPAPVVQRGPEKIFFDFDSYLLTLAGKGALEDNAIWLKSQPEINILIEGHADERGSDTYNLALGENRARAARDYLVNSGIAPERISIISYGEEQASRGAGEAAWAQDRRADVKTN